MAAMGAVISFGRLDRPRKPGGWTRSLVDWRELNHQSLEPGAVRMEELLVDTEAGHTQKMCVLLGRQASWPVKQEPGEAGCPHDQGIAAVTHCAVH